jgi:predicted PurR-regulated permease PerM
VVVALSVIAGSILAGVTGAVVAVPMVSVAWSVITELRARPEPEPAGRSPDHRSASAERRSGPTGDAGAGKP